MVSFTLDKFGVPIDGGKQGPMLMPKRRHLFRVRFLNFGNVGNQAKNVTLNAESVTLPKLQHETHEIHGYNSKAYYAGKHTWTEVEMTVRDDVTNAVNRDIDAQMQRQLDHFNQTGYRSATDYKFNTLIDMMDGSDDAILETWELEGCFISNYDPGDGSYDSSDHKRISLTIRYDNATHIDEAGNRLMIDPVDDPQGRTL